MESPIGKAPRSPSSSVLIVVISNPFLPPPQANGIMLSHKIAAGFTTGRWMFISQPSNVIKFPAKDDQLLTWAKFTFSRPQNQREHVGRGAWTVSYGVVESILRKLR